MAHFKIKKGMNIDLAGAPAKEVQEATFGETVCVQPTEFTGVKPRLRVKEGDTVKRGTPLFVDKRNVAFQGCAPAAGTVTTIHYGPRRVIERIEITTGGDEAESFPSHDMGAIRSLSREQILGQLLETGYLAYIRQRPFGKMADPEVKPKSIFVNAMATAPFRTDPAIAVQGSEGAFQAGLFALNPLTDGPVRLILPSTGDELPTALSGADGVDIHTFEGPHPAGNTSVHIHRLDPIFPGDTVWIVDAVDVIQIGKLFLEGRLPGTRIIALGGPGVKAAARKHYLVPIGGSLQNLLAGNLEDGEQRVVNGDALGGKKVAADGPLPFYSRGLTVVPEDPERHLLRWMAPGMDRYSRSRAFVSTWLKSSRSWSLGTNANGSLRAMVLTGLYDKYMPMRVMVDYLVRAVIANDTDEAIKLGILETDPEDFALCSFVCPSKTDVGKIISQGLALIEEEGI